MSRRVVAVVSDLFFATRIAATAEAAGVELESLPADAARARYAADPPAASGPAPSLFILDLAGGEPPLALARALKSSHARAVPIVAFYSHVEQATREAALAAGIDHVLPRSAFTARLPALLLGE